MAIDFNELTRQTIELSESLSPDLQLDHVDSATEEVQESEFSFEGPGLIYYFDCGISTFCLKGVVSDDLAWDIDLLNKEDPKFLEQFRLKQDWDKDNFVFYPTNDVCEAEVIAQEMFHKRFPRQEAILCNISDPGFSWWLDEGDSGLKIFYHSQMIERDERYMQLGPLGDESLAQRKFAEGYNFLAKFFSINEFSSTENSFHISTTEGNIESFNIFKNIFAIGLWEYDYLIENSRGEEKSFFLFLKEIALLRRFWIEIQSLF